MSRCCGGFTAGVVPGAGAYLLCCLPTLPLVYFIAPYPPAPLPQRGRGGLKVYFAGGFAPGTPALNRLRHLQSLPYRCTTRGLAFFVACLPCLWFLILPPIPPTPFPGGEGGAPKFISPGASPPAPLHLTAFGTHRACQAGARRRTCPVGRLPTLPSVCFSAPYPPSPRSQSALPRRGRGRFLVYFAGGFAPRHPCA